LRAIERNEVPHVRKVIANAVHRREIVAVGADDRCAAVSNQVAEIVGDEPEVEWNQNRAELGTA
jgi:hypothetical protein